MAEPMNGRAHGWPSPWIADSPFWFKIRLSRVEVTDEKLVYRIASAGLRLKKLKN